MSVAVAFAASAMTGRFASMKAVGGIISTSASALFLFAIAIVNMLVRFAAISSTQHDGCVVKRGGNLALAQLPASSTQVRSQVSERIAKCIAVRTRSAPPALSQLTSCNH
jgi:hypothetical protein